MGPCPVNRGAVALVGTDVQPRISGQCGTSGQSSFTVQLPVNLLPRCRLLALHITQPVENLDIVLLDNSLTIWCILMMNDAFMIKENCQHHFHLTLELACLFWPRSRSL